MGDATSSWSCDASGTQIKIKGNLDISTLLKTAQMYPGRTIYPTLSGRKLVVTEQGYMGLAPYWVEVGYALAVLLGCSVPVILQRHGSHFHLQGDCFVQGWMRGEMLDAMGLGDEEMVEYMQRMQIPPIVIR